MRVVYLRLIDAFVDVDDIVDGDPNRTFAISMNVTLVTAFQLLFFLGAEIHAEWIELVITFFLDSFQSIVQQVRKSV